MIITNNKGIEIIVETNLPSYYTITKTQNNNDSFIFVFLIKGVNSCSSKYITIKKSI